MTIRYFFTPRLLSQWLATLREHPPGMRLGLALGLSLLVHAVLILSIAFADAVPSGTIAPQAPNIVVSMPAAPGKAPASAARGEAPTLATNNPAPPAPPLASEAPKVDTRYFDSTELTRSARPAGPVDLNLPEARLILRPGTLVLRLWIDSRGQVVSYQIDAPDLPEEYAMAVAETFAAQRFEPGEMLGRAVNSIIKLEINNESPSESQP